MERYEGGTGRFGDTIQGFYVETGEYRPVKKGEIFLSTNIDPGKAIVCTTKVVTDRAILKPSKN